MKKITLTLLLFVITTSLSAQSIGTFQQKASMGNNLTSRSEAGMVSYNGELYILGGSDGGGPKNFIKYNPVSDVFTDLAPLGSSLFNNLSKLLFVVQNKIYNISATGTGVSIYDIATNTWEVAVNQLAIYPYDNTACLVGENLYFVGPENTFYSYGLLTNIQTQLTDRPGIANLIKAVSFELNGKVYWGGGSPNPCNQANNVCVSSLFYAYDPVSNSWSQKAFLPQPSSGASGVGLNGYGYVGSGLVSDCGNCTPENSGEWFKYNPVNDTWSNLPPMNGFDWAGAIVPGMSFGSISTVNSDIFVFGGRYSSGGGDHTDNLHTYNTLTDTWTRKNETGQNRSNASGFYLNGKLYIYGGREFNYGDSSYDFWEYSIASNAWTFKEDFAADFTVQPMFSYSSDKAAVEVNGKGYFVGGFSPDIIIISKYSDELLEYNPSNNQWSLKASYPGGARGSMVSFSYNNQLYAGMGTTNVETGINTAYSDFYKYDPSNDTWTQMANAPVQSGERYLGHFMIGDYAYVVLSNNAKVLKYSFVSNNWESIETTGNEWAGFYAEYSNVAFAYNGKGYLKSRSIGTDGQLISEFNPLTNVWQPLFNVPFKGEEQSIIPTPEGVYFGFGFAGYNDSLLGIITSNELNLLKFNTGNISEQLGVFEPKIWQFYPFPYYCGYMYANSSQATYDTDDDLFALVIAGSQDIAGVCYKVNSLSLSEPFRTLTTNFGNGFVENAMFLNKSVTMNLQNTIPAGGKMRLYFTNNELNKLVADFNMLYGTTKTVQDIKILRYGGNNLDNLDPLDNLTDGYYATLTATITDFQNGKYFEFESIEGAGIYGEIYAVLLTPENLGVSEFETAKITLFPNPTNSVLNIKSDLPVNSIQVIDITGRITAISNFENNQIDVSGLASGVYFLHIATDNYVYKEKFIKQ